MWIVRSLCEAQMESALIIHFMADSVVSTAAVSLRAMSRRAPDRRAPLISAVSLLRSMPFDDSRNSSSSPLTRRSLMKPLVLILACWNASSLMITCFFSNGRRRMSTTNLRTSAMVSLTCGSESFCLMARNPSIPRSSGKARRTWSMLISMPVFSEAMAAAFFTAQFCTGGR